MNDRPDTRHLITGRKCGKCKKYFPALRIEGGHPHARVMIEESSFEQGDFYFDANKHVRHSTVCPGTKK